MIKKVLGIDCSSTTIGWCCLEVNDADNSISHKESGFIKPPKKGNIIERIYKTRTEIQSIINRLKPDHIGIEEIIQFMKGKSTAKTIIMLTTFNRMVGLASYDALGVTPEFFNVMSIRHGLKLNKILPKKEDMPDLVANHLGIIFPYQYKKTGKLIEENYDRADGIAVALYYSFILTGKIKHKIKKTKKPKVKISKVKQ